MPETHPDEVRIREARAASNHALEQHDIAGIVAVLDEEYQVMGSDGTFRVGRRETGEAFASRFASFPDARYVRIPETVEVSSDSTVASEIGRWSGSWTATRGSVQTGGRYAARWHRAGGAWLLHSELFVRLFCEGPGCG